MAVLTLVAGKDPVQETGGGHSSFVRALARAAVQAGHEPHIFCISHDSGVLETDYGFVHRVPSPLRFLIRRSRTGFRSYTASFHAPLIGRALVNFLQKKSAPYLIHGIASWATAGVYARRKLQRHGVEVKLVTSCYTTLLHEYNAKLAALSHAHGLGYRCSLHAQKPWQMTCAANDEQAGYRESDLVLVNYQSVEDIVTRQCGPGICFRKMPYTSEIAFLRGKEEQLPPAPDFITRLQPADAPLIVTVSRHDSRKGLDVFLRALARLRDSSVKFRACMVGGDTLLENHRRLAEKLGLGESVALPGFVEDAYSCLLRSDIFVLPSLEEGSGSLSLLEAMMARTAIVAANVDGIPEDVTDEETALLVNPGDEVQLASAVARLLGDARLRERLAQNAAEAFSRKFSPDTYAAALGDLYEEFGFK